MGDFFSQYSGVETFFFMCAVFGGFFVLIKFAMMFMGGMDHDVSHDFDTSGHDPNGYHSDSDTGFHILSLQSISSFFMMFGLVGLAMYRQSHFGTFISVAGAAFAGAVSVWVIGRMFLMFSRLKSNGAITIDSTVGAQGKVYTKIPEKGLGRVLINAKNSLREYDASANDEKGIDTGTPVRVIWVDGNVLVVERI